MKKIFKVLIGFVSIVSFAILFSSCERNLESEGLTSGITYYVTFGFDDTSSATDIFGGDQFVIIEKGTSYDVNQHFTATENGEDVSAETEISGTVDGDTPGYYPISYAAVNADGYDAGKTKAVFVSDPDVSANIAGDYSATVYRTPTGYEYTKGYDASISKVADGIFYINRLLGSYYYDGEDFGYKAYGAYYVHGYVYLHADNTITHVASFCPAWLDTLEGDGIKDGLYDPATGIITFTSLYAGGREFHVTLTPKTL